MGWLRQAKHAFDRTTVFFIVLAIGSAAALWHVKSPQAMQDAVWHGLVMFAMIVPMIVMGLFLGGVLSAIANPAKVAPLLGADSGWRGLVLATFIGALTPGGPFTAFPLVFAIFAAGADIGAVIAFLTGWGLIALQRVVVWEIPLLGADYAALRVLACLPLPILAGALARLAARHFAIFSGIGVDTMPASALSSSDRGRAR